MCSLSVAYEKRNKIYKIRIMSEKGYIINILL